MADDSPGKVQALRAMFAEKNNPLMGMRPPGGKLSNRPWKSVLVDSTENVPPFKERIIKEQKPTFQNVNKVLPFPPIKSSSTTNEELFRNTNGFSDEKAPNKVAPKPFIGPKPPQFSQQTRTNSTLNEKTESESKTTESRTFSDSQSLLDSQAKSKAFAETIASFMFTNGFNGTGHESVSTNSTNNKSNQPPIPKPRNCQLRTNLQDQLNVINSQNNNRLSSKNSSGTLSDLINSDNYICKSKLNFKRKELPSLESLGPAPLKPSKPPNMVLPTKYCSTESDSSPASIRSTQPPQHPPPSLPPKFLPPVPQRPGYPCPPRPHTPPPLPPIQAPIIKPQLSLREEIEELYEDTLLGDHNKRPVSLIPEYTEEEEAEELYNDADVEDSCTLPTPLNLLLKPKDPPPPCPSEYLQPNSLDSSEELYQDAEDGNEEEFYEEMPCDIISPDELGSPVYSNNKKEVEKLQREEEKKIRKEQKEKEKRERELEKLRRKFGLTGEEIPIDDGLVKTDSRGGKGDLPVKKGETVLILRMEGNPSGRWLVKNERGKIGYVELANIEVDPLSVKSAKGTSEDGVCTTPIEKNIHWLSKITACVRL